MMLQIAKGYRIGKLIVIEELERLRLPCGQANRVFRCKCDCGRETIVRLVHLSRGRIKSCGCSHGERHGMCHSRLYTIWRGMKNRCYGEKTIQPHLYKDKGITVCERWKNSFLAFKEWAEKNGFAPGLQIDRKDNSLGYCPENCRFVTPAVNSNNRDVTLKVDYNGNIVSLAALLQEEGKMEHYVAIRTRILRGWEHARAIDTPIRIGNYK
jgi:hypothetical protein